MDSNIILNAHNTLLSQYALARINIRVQICMRTKRNQIYKDHQHTKSSFRYWFVINVAKKENQAKNHDHCGTMPII